MGFADGTGRLAVTLRANGSSPVVVYSTNAAPVGRWFNAVVAYDTATIYLYVDGASAGNAYAPNLAPGAAGLRWDAAWLGNTATNAAVSAVGQIDDFVVRNGALAAQVVPQVMLTPEFYQPSSIVMRLQGQASTGAVIDAASAADVVSVGGGSLLNLSATPSVPLWTYGAAQGTYFEVISGPRKEPIAVGGTFTLTQVSQDPYLR